MSSNTDNPALIIDHTLIQTQNQEKPQNLEEKQYLYHYIEKFPKCINK